MGRTIERKTGRENEVERKKHSNNNSSSKNNSKFGGAFEDIRKNTFGKNGHADRNQLRERELID